MDSIFAKTIFFLASILTVLVSPEYIKISSDSLIYDFKTGDHTPIYYFLNTENVGDKKVRFDTTSLSDWVFVSKEGDQPSAKTSLELAQYSPLNFVLEIHPERLPDGTSNAEVIVEAVDLQDFSILESKEVNIAVNKNFKSSLPVLSPTESPSSTSVLSPVPTVIMTPGPPQAPKAAADLNPVLKQIQSLIDSISELLGRFFGVY